MAGTLSPLSPLPDPTLDGPLCDRCHGTIESESFFVEPPSIRVCLECLTEQETRALERDLERASAVQVRLLPPPIVRSNGWEVGYRYRPAGPVSGDFCDVLLADDPRGPLHFLLGDVSGKGVAASILMANLQAIFRSLVPQGLPLARLVEQANRLFASSTLASSYATLVIGRVDPSGSLEVVNAGHPAPLLGCDGTVCEIPATGIPLGLFREAGFETRCYSLSDGDVLFLYSDGYPEDSARRLAPVLASETNGGVAHVLSRSLDGFPVPGDGGTKQEDDVTVLAVRRTGVGQ